MSRSTVAAIATPHGTGGIGIIRISGPNSLEIANKVFSKLLGKSHAMVLGNVIKNNKIIDNALACYFKAPKSYTGEDVVEFYCHGGMVVCKMVLEAVILNGAAIAAPGEFTRRAFLNGRIDLAQAEAVGDIINAKTENAVKVAANQLSGSLSKKISEIRSKTVDITAHLLATIDFPEVIEPIPGSELKDMVNGIAGEISGLLLTADDGRIIMDGLNAAIVGSPNVGKSSLLNAICGQDRAIVTDIEGTTRDVLDVQVNIRGCKVNLLDTAGIRESDDIIEKHGIRRSIDSIKSADIVLLVLDASRELNETDKEIIRLVEDKETICLVNKSDLPVKIIPPGFKDVVYVSALTGKGLDELFSLISERFSKGELTSEVMITNERHKNSLVYAQSCISSAFEAISQNQPPDIVLGDLELCIAALGEIDGMTVSDEIIDNIFSNFCVGK